MVVERRIEAARQGPPCSDRGLIEAVRAGKRSSIGHFLQRLECVRRFLVAIARRQGLLLGPETLAELSQEVITRVWERLDRYEGRASLESWVYIFCLNTLRDHRRALARRRWVAIDDHLPERLWVGLDVDERQLIRREIEGLRPTQWEIIRLRHYEELSFAQIAQAKRLPESTVKSRYYRGLERLRRRLPRP